MLLAIAQQDTTATTHDPLAEILLTKGILTPDEVKLIDQAVTPQQVNELMARILLGKGAISKSDYDRIAGKTLIAAQPNAAPEAPKAQGQTGVLTTNRI